MHIRSAEVHEFISMATYIANLYVTILLFFCQSHPPFTHTHTHTRTHTQTHMCGAHIHTLFTSLMYTYQVIATTHINSDDAFTLEKVRAYFITIG